MSATEARVLIIEDNDALRAMLFAILRHQPLGVDTSAGAEEALEKTRQCDYALILIDMSLANGEALTFLTRFREERPEATTFVLAVRDPNSEASIDAALVSAMVNKPLEIDTLADVVRECALVVPPPDDPLPCPPAESEFRSHFDDSGAFYN
ncbi:MAG TPA: response regulator [Thermoanaerobaculia bacterium]|jgi:two-component system response regulator PilR (NtrC family)|nr:response regulator [Thermoanaerobaculia bacterium]